MSSRFVSRIVRREFQRNDSGKLFHPHRLLADRTIARALLFHRRLRLIRIKDVLVEHRWSSSRSADSREFNLQEDFFNDLLPKRSLNRKRSIETCAILLRLISIDISPNSSSVRCLTDKCYAFRANNTRYRTEPQKYESLILIAIFMGIKAILRRQIGI